MKQYCTCSECGETFTIEDVDYSYNNQNSLPNLCSKQICKIISIIKSMFIFLKKKGLK